MIAEFSGISSPYEPPRAPDLIVSTEREDVETSLACLLAYSMERFSLPPDA
jgi:adenylylsulfate kinase-like enzyme